MRLRNDPKAEEKLAEHPTVVVQEPENYKGKWKTIFKNDNPIHIEIGTGKGGFVTGMAKQNPDINYIGIERFTTIVVKAMNNIVDADISNAKLLNVNAVNILQYFEEGEVDRVYLNFSDPWPKDRHARRRLTYKDFLDNYKQIMKKNGEIHFKTDNQALFEFSLESFSKYGMLLKNISLDLHKSDIEGNVMTEYERKFSEEGMRIYRCEAQFIS
ncbi:tRNA (guanosine(46)-N7)-methyltransferase TrmB [Lottiidibacillus patelloidae]|uniref:tRNA (guanine-N(7)-)-methyltransferase n=1 Tax=Lottiidibacillus patelloidae TaxID=2670334 RepID=A0A263BQY8_9BACI|nr:tRNA (guanosine(46)-N7)-methyltransferase TrmB [Lottiidibacillus patelloidae]OZM56094.1 tRNA (guanosine(46)-N7)-methyltransferase TrmB [Lottiidibacillus patelloidae]